jgi:sigma-B regulation protein RsbU (phosphoserine phosphatase)
MGLFCQNEFPTRLLSLEPGEGLFLYTDGLTEATNARGEHYGEPRVVEALCRHLRSSADELIRVFADEARPFEGVARPSDDRTLMVLQRT